MKIHRGIGKLSQMYLDYLRLFEWILHLEMNTEKARIQNYD